MSGVTRLCERPGCSDEASVAYGMRPEDLVFWLDVIRNDEGQSFGVLCRRHADAMVVPRNWTLDDLRDPDLHLFRPPPGTEVTRTRTRRVRTGDDTAEQLRLASFADAVDDTAADGHPQTAEPDVSDEAQSWTPQFDAGDDLDGLLSARSPLLARAFRGDDRPSR